MTNPDDKGNILTLEAARDIVWNILAENQDTTCTMHAVLNPLRVRALHILLVVSEAHEITSYLAQVSIQAVQKARREQ
jgi:hypothetical protein